MLNQHLTPTPSTQTALAQLATTIANDRGYPVDLALHVVQSRLSEPSSDYRHPEFEQWLAQASDAYACYNWLPLYFAINQILPIGEEFEP